MSIDEKILEGKYIFLKDGQQYSEEVFSLMMDDSINGNYLYTSEILCRVPSGEFLKINVGYETSNSFDPLSVKVFRSLGDKVSTEQYRIDPKNKQVYYTFSGVDGENSYERNVSGKFHISTPAFVTSTLMTQMKKVSVTQKTLYNVITTSNLWTYENHFIESNIELEQKSLDAVPITLNDKEVMTTHCEMSQVTEENSKKEQAADFYLSKHFNIPYKADFPGDIEVRIERLKVFENDYKNMFKN
jgi:hypothetical protein